MGLDDGIVSDGIVSTATPLQDLLDRVEELYAAERARVFIGLVGAPGSGKTTLASLLSERLGADRSVVVPMDGFHLAKSVIAGTALEDRRGAIDTFDGWGYLQLLRRIKSQGGQPVYAPTFRRGLEDPIAASILVRPEVPIVITEGNYLLVGRQPWLSVRRLLTEAWFVETSEQERTTRLAERHMTYGMSPEAARSWVAGTDAANASLVRSTRDEADRIVVW